MSDRHEALKNLALMVELKGLAERVVAERDTLHAEVERLRGELKDSKASNMSLYELIQRMDREAAEAHKKATGELADLRGELAAAKEHSKYQEKECRLWAAAANIGTWPLSEQDTKNTGFWGRFSANMTKARNTATVRAEAAEVHAAELRAALEALNHAAKVAVFTQYGSSFDEDTPLPIRLLDGTCDDTDTALSRTPAKSLAKVKAEALREGANLIRQTTPSRTSQWDDYGAGKEDGRHYAIEQLEAEAERLEKEAGDAQTKD